MGGKETKVYYSGLHQVTDPHAWGGNYHPEGRSRYRRRALFFGHALDPQDPSTNLIRRVMEEHGLGTFLKRPKKGMELVHWLGFPFHPREGESVWVDICVVPMLAGDFYRHHKKAPIWECLHNATMRGIAEARTDEVDLTVGWGALTKEKGVSGHGQRFYDEHPDLRNSFSSTHGDAGTAVSVLKMLERSQARGYAISIIGANGATGEAIAVGLCKLKNPPRFVRLVGKPDKIGKTEKVERLRALRGKMRGILNGRADEITIEVCQDLDLACKGCNIVVVATGGTLKLLDTQVDKGTIVYDMTAPRACQLSDEIRWGNQLVLTAGGCLLPAESLPRGFGKVMGIQIADMGAGGDNVVWGCLAETMVRASAGNKGRHVYGKPINGNEVNWCERHFGRLKILPQPLDRFGQRLPENFEIGYAGQFCNIDSEPPDPRETGDDVDGAVIASTSGTGKASAASA